MEFNIEDYKGKYGMHCKTEEEAKDFCDYLHKIKRTWSNGEKYCDLTFFDIYKSDTVYYFNEGGHTLT